MRYTSLSAMRSSAETQKRRSAEDSSSFMIGLFFVGCCSIALLLFCSKSHAELIDRVVAFVDDKAITLSELEENYRDSVKLKPEIMREEVLNTLINRTLLLREAKKLRIDAPSKDEIIHEYIELKLRTFIKITEEDIKDFYEKNTKEFGKTELDDVRDKIEDYLIEKEVNLRLKKHIEDLRSNAYIKIQLNSK